MFVKRAKFIVTCLLCIIAIEIIARLILPATRLNTLEAVSQILTQDNTLFWRQRPHLNTKFQAVNVFTNFFGFRSKEINLVKDIRTYRIICLGASPTFGWGVEFFDAYPFVLEQMLQNVILSKNVEVINAGQIGYTSYQGIVLLEKYLLNLAPDLITVSYVLNDIDRYRFFKNTGLSDNEFNPNNPFVIEINNIISRSRFYFLMQRIANFFIGTNKRLSASLLKREFDLAKVRVPALDYRRNLEKIITLCKINNIKLVFIKMPINLSLPNLTCDERDIAMTGNTLSKFYYDMAANYEKRKDYKDAAVFFKKAKDYQVIDCAQDGKNYQAIMEETAYKYQIPLVDADRIFDLVGSRENLFNTPQDPIHPNSEGHRIIAEALYKEVRKLVQ